MDAGIRKQLLLGLWALAVSTVLPEGQVVSGVVSGVASMVEEAEVVSEEGFKIEEGMAAVVEEEALATKAVEASHPGAVAEIVVGMVALMDMEHLLLMLQLAPAAHVAVATVAAVGIAEEDMEAPGPQIAVVLACPRQLVGMTRVVAVAHMMIDPADIVATLVEAMEIVMVLLAVEAVATWSR